MNMKVISFRVIFFTLSFIFLSKSTLASETCPAKKVVNDFYHSYLNDDTKNNALLSEKYISEEVTKSIENSTKCNYDTDGSEDAAEPDKLCSQERECKTSKGHFICNWNGIWVETDVNYFIKSQDTWPSWHNNIRIMSLEQNTNSAIYEVSLGVHPDPVMKLKVTLKPVNNNWKITSVTEY